MKRRHLVPTLGVIEQDLFGVSGAPDSDEVQERPRRAAFMEPEPFRSRPVPTQADEVEVIMPSYLKDAVTRRMAAKSIGAHHQPFAPGQVRQITEHLDEQGKVLRPLARPVALLLDQQASVSNRWSGWLVAPEVDYASAWDVLLEAGVDEPFDPQAGMVQAWNPMQCHLAENAPLLATISSSRLEAVRAVAAQFPRLPTTDASRPGFIAPRTIAGHSVLTGSPLGGSDDERRVYQSLYFQLARELA